jgi:glucose-6-phosphate 1-dehydrogenase
MNAKPLEPSILVIFGITGDLAGRYLLPALYHLVKDGLLDEQTEILGVTRGDTTTDDLFEKVELCVNEVDNICDPVALKAMRERTNMFKMNLDDPADYDRLLQKLNEIEDAKGVCMHRIYYLSIPPAAYQPVVRQMGERGLNVGCPHGEGASRLLVEKPFGRDLKSAEELINETGKHFREDQIFRIDHYLAKDAVEELLTGRQADPELDARWNASQIASVDIIAKEQIGIEGRANFYDPLGALRDFIQSHLIQVLGLVTMDAPPEFDSQPVHAAKEAALAQIEPVPSAKAVRGQYAGYREEAGNPNSVTETFAAVTAYSQAERWQGVPLKLLTGKALDERRSEVVVNWRGQPAGHFSMQGHNLAYERVLADAVRGDHTIFSTKDEILNSWRILQPVIEAWQQNGEDLVIYQPGTEGPTS